MGGLSIGSGHSTKCIYRGLKPAYSTYQPLIDFCNNYNNLYIALPIATQRFLLIVTLISANRGQAISEERCVLNACNK